MLKEYVVFKISFLQKNLNTVLDIINNLFYFCIGFVLLGYKIYLVIKLKT